MTLKQELEDLKAGISQPLNELSNEIAEMEKRLSQPSSVKCNHLICDACKQAMEEEKKEMDILQIKLNEKKQLYEKLKEYGINQ